MNEQAIMTCEAARLRILDVVAGDRVAADLAEHLASCAECAREYEQATQVRLILSAAQGPAPSPMLAHRLALHNAAATASEEIKMDSHATPLPAIEGGARWPRFGLAEGALAVVVIVGIALALYGASGRWTTVGPGGITPTPSLTPLVTSTPARPTPTATPSAPEAFDAPSSVPTAVVSLAEAPAAVRALHDAIAAKDAARIAGWIADNRSGLVASDSFGSEGGNYFVASEMRLLLTGVLSPEVSPVVQGYFCEPTDGTSACGRVDVMITGLGDAYDLPEATRVPGEIDPPRASGLPLRVAMWRLTDASGTGIIWDRWKYPAGYWEADTAFDEYRLMLEELAAEVPTPDKLRTYFVIR